jgi:septum formation topological specificity factor MinE
MQSAALSYISGNQPAYTKKEAALLEDELQKVIQSYIDRDLIEAGVVEVELLQDNFVASAEINVSEPKALWRIFGEMRQTL